MPEESLATFLSNYSKFTMSINSSTFANLLNKIGCWNSFYLLVLLIEYDEIDVRKINPSDRKIVMGLEIVNQFERFINDYSEYVTLCISMAREPQKFSAIQNAYEVASNTAENVKTLETTF